MFIIITVMTDFITAVKIVLIYAVIMHLILLPVYIAIFKASKPNHYDNIPDVIYNPYRDETSLDTIIEYRNKEISKLSKEINELKHKLSDPSLLIFHDIYQDEIKEKEAELRRLTS